MATRSMRALRRTIHRERQFYEAKVPYRTVLTVQYQTKITPSDLEGFEAIPVRGHNDDGSRIKPAGYDRPDLG